MKVIQLCLTLCDPMDYIVHGILQARILEWEAFPFSRGSSQPRDQTQISRVAGRFFYQLSHQVSPRILELAAYPFFSGSSWPNNWTGISCIAGGFFTSWATIHSHKTFIEDMGRWDFLEYWIDCWLQHLRRNLIAVSFKWNLEGKTSRHLKDNRSWLINYSPDLACWLFWQF